MVGILTWHNAINHGAVLQAFASQSVLQNLGLDVCFVNHEPSFTTTVPLLERIAGKAKRIAGGELRDRADRERFETEKRSLFRTFVSNDLIVKMDAGYSGIDRLMIGSDMVFSLKEGYHPLMFGLEYSGEEVFSYAACACGSTLHDAIKLGVADEISEGLRKFTGIGCRDVETEKFVSDLIGGSEGIVSTIDPVLLYGYSRELEGWDSGKWANSSPYIVIYSYYTNMNSKKTIESVRDFANEIGCRIISLGYFHPWCDECVNADPKEFLEIIKHARMVVTDTFHGTVFSLVAKTNFVSTVRGNGFKLRDLLCKCGMESRIADESSLASRLRSGIDFAPYDAWLPGARSQSMNFLEAQVR